MKQKLLPLLLIFCFQIAKSQSVTILPGNNSSGNIVSNSGAFPTMNIFPSGTSNPDKMVISHSTGFPNWGLQYRDFGDKFVFIGGVTPTPTLTTDLYNSRVGVGIDNPGHKLDVLGGSWNLVTPTEGDFRVGDPTYNFRLGVATGGGGAGDIRQFATGGTNRFIWGTSALDRMALNASGNLGIGTIDPVNKLHIKDGDAEIEGSTPFLYFKPGVNQNMGIKFYDPLSENGLAYIYYETSNDLLKLYNGTTTSAGLNFNSSNMIGLNTTTPGGKFHIKYNSGMGNPHLMLEEASSTDGGRITFKNAGTTKFWDLWGYPDATNANANFNIYYSGLGNILSIQGNGNVGIGTTSPDNKLDVLGVIRANEVVVETGWADYVFDNNYELKDLNEVEKYINENKHLPNVPSAKEVQEKGAHVAELMTKMMAKIEELTLYTIKQQKEIDELKTLLK